MRLSLISTALFFASNALALRARSTDPFYTPHPGFENTTAGTILKHRPVTPGFFGDISNPIDGYQLLYRSTAINGGAIAAATTIFVPKVSTIKDRWISFHTAYDTSDPDCDPSKNYLYDGSQSNTIVSVEMLYIELFVALGYIVASPDFEGPDEAFGASPLAGMVTLDGIRAVNNFHWALELTSPNPVVAGTGYSGGSIASGWAAQLQPTYAPELNIAVWSLGGVVSNLTAVFENIDGTFAAGYVPPVISGLRKPSAYGETLNPVIEQIITPLGASYLDYTDTHCQTDDLEFFSGKTLLTTDVQTLGPGLLTDPTIASILEGTLLGTIKPSAPLYVLQGLNDEVIPYDTVTEAVNNWCSMGASVTFLTYLSGGHDTTEIFNIPNTIEFISNALNGQVAAGCSSSTTADASLDPLYYGLDLEPILTRLVTILENYGKNDANVKKNINVLKGKYQSPAEKVKHHA